jgi:hypothetical protein
MTELLKLAEEMGFGAKLSAISLGQVIHTHTHIYIHTHIHTYIHTHTHTHIYIY